MNPQDHGFLGILSLDTAFPRIPGDAGNPASYAVPARLHVVEGADSTGIVRDARPEAALLERFIDGARALEAEGACAIVSTCGFLALVQADIAGAVRLPVMLSALSLYPLVRQVCAGKVGILTASAAALGLNTMRAAGVNPEGSVIAGLDGHALFAETFLAPKARQSASFDREAMEALVVGEARQLVQRGPEIGAILLECGNLPPYADAIREATGRPVFSILDAAVWMMRAARGGLYG